ncbi:ArdC family protein [Geobacter sulfurreducens]|uniref:ArdC family protein n=1 Tax=Geobacter sulfurreducens TaxID=35554 RepID=UPI000DBBA98E|nr:zincin-like metallopeptidase domain-containing protein [Geobacter sulfurreducens]BBA71026.1 DNA primase TraC [Geobacter sulfurreducens]
MCKVYDVINNRIMELLDQGTVPWRKPWNAESNMPKNLISRKDYRGVNVFLLSCLPFGSPYWLTYKQVQDRGGYVRKGEKSTPVIFWKWIDKNDGDIQDNEIPTSTKGKVPLLRYYSVFNMDQVEGIKAPEPQEVIKEFNPIHKAEEVIASMPQRPEIKYGGNRAYYSPSYDYIQLPHQHTFQSPEEYYSTAFHELAHATGHSSRVGRKSILETSYFGSHEYSKEELVAEMGAAFLCGVTGIENRTIENSAAYIQGWLRKLKEDKTLLIHAAAQAQKAADFILNRKGGEDTEEEQ